MWNMTHASDITCTRINSLPSELLEEIFTNCLPEKCYPDPSKAPLLLCHVCSKWRAIALGHSQLWNSLSVPSTNTFSRCKREAIATVLRFWFGNLKSPSLSFSLDLDKYRYNEPHDGFACLDDIVIWRSNHMRHLDLRVQSKFDLPRFFTLPSGNLQNLESLILHIGEIDESLTVFRGTPALHHLVLISEPGRSMLHPIHFPWSQLTVLRVYLILPFDQWWMIFRQCRRLKECALALNFDPNTSSLAVSDETGVATYPNLTELALINMRYPFSGPSLQAFDFPALSTLKIQGGSSEAFWTKSALSHPNLPLHLIRRLNLRVPTLTGDDLVDFLFDTPNVTELYLDIHGCPCSQCNQRLWATLPAQDSSSKRQLLPKLEVLDLLISLHGANPVSQLCLPHILANVIRTRQDSCLARPSGSEDTSPVSCLRHVAVKFSSTAVALVADVKAALEPLGIDGLDLKIE